MRAHLIFYVKDQQASTEFLSYVLNSEPSLNVPGMSEFRLSDTCVLGVMPESGIKRLLQDKIPDPSGCNGIPRAELYLVVDNAQTYLTRAIHRGAVELSAVSLRDWGDKVGYCMEENGHIIAFAETP